MKLNESMFPEIFITGLLPEKYTKESLIADGLCAWGICMAGLTSKLPENFGKGMALIHGEVGTATPDGLSKLADEILTAE